jgi:hypothetical protein
MTTERRIGGRLKPPDLGHREDGAPLLRLRAGRSFIPSESRTSIKGQFADSSLPSKHTTSPATLIHPTRKMASRILVTGATGKQGGACVNALLARGGAFEVYGLTRSAKSPAAQKLAARGVHVVEGNLDAPEALLKQIPKPLDGIFAVSVFAGRGQDGAHLNTIT